ncbi:MAG: hypothetical protein K0S16_611 [Moraxellaceae bacterium]|nr:hypothetical protein [Moraxellaceae bacterium]
MIMHTWRRQLAIIQDWSGVARACIPSVLMVLTYLHYFVGIACLLYWDPSGKLVNRDVVIAGIPMLAFWMGSGVLVTLLGLALRLRSPESGWFVYLSVALYTLSQVWGGYMVGSLSFVIGIVLTGAPLVGFALISRPATVVAVIIAFPAILLSNLGAAHGWLPYAPMFKAPHDTASALLWTHSQFFFAAPHILCLVVLSALVFGHWRKREEGVLLQSLTDALTGVHNRRSILDLLDNEIARSRRQGTPLAVVLLDLDHFKRINDTWGHPTGDRVLQQAAEVLKGCIRQVDEIGRFGGEEFLLLLPDTGRDGALQLAERCRAALAALVATADNGEAIPVSGSFGLVCSGGAAPVSSELLVRLADEALYEAKQGGRNRIVEAALPELDPLAAASLSPAMPAALWQGRLRRLSTVPGNTGVFLENVDGKPWWRSLEGWRRLFAGTREWSPVAKVGLVVFLTILIKLGALGWMLYALQRDDVASLVAPAWYPRAFWLVGTELAIATVLVAMSVWLKSRAPDARWFQHLGLQFYSLSLLTDGFVLGIMYLPTGVMFACSPVVGFLLFRRYIVLQVWAVALVTIVVTAYAGALGWIPYAPIISLDGPAYHLHEPYWIYSIYIFFTPTLAVVLILVDQVLGRWREREAQIQDINRTDILTQAHNRRSILERLEKEAQRSARSGMPLTVALLDLDHFKRINDTWGHPTGDRVLQQAAEVLKGAVRESDVVGRFGGEEFMLVLPDTGLEAAQMLLERCRRQLAQIVVTADSGENFFISASFGAAGTGGTASPSATTPDFHALIRVADAALYRAKAAGRNRVEALSVDVWLAAQKI